MRMPSRSIAFLLLFSSSLVHAGTLAGPEAVVKATTQSVLERIGTDPGIIEDPDRLFSTMNELVLPRFDFDRISKRVLGKYWKQASDEQRRRFVSEFQRLLINTYAAALGSSDGSSIRFRPSKSRSETEVSVRTEVARNGGSGIPINYEMHLVPEGWKVYDVAVDGVSLSMTYRNDFRSQARREGIDALIARMATHNRSQRQP